MQVRYQLRHRPVAPKGNWNRLLQMPSTPITMAITRTVDPERAREVAAWARAGQDLMSASPGYLGSGWVRPDPESPEWHMLFRFADAETLAAWEHSPEREWWVASAQGLVSNLRVEQRTGIEGWFDEPTSVEVLRSPPAAPPRWKQMVSIFLVFYPLSLGANALLGLFDLGWVLPLRVLALVVLVTPIMTYLALPFVTRALRPWLMRGVR
jgi:antibiotic biosynthesis monooxygenase (ABM) superfamily enzyme